MLNRLLFKYVFKLKQYYFSKSNKFEVGAKVLLCLLYLYFIMSLSVKCKELTKAELSRLQEVFKEDFEELRRFGETGSLLPARYEPHACAVRAMAVRPDDLWLLTFPRSGTHMMAEMLWLLLHDLDYKKAAEIPLSERNTFIEIFSLSNGEVPIGYKVLETRPSPRLISTHLPLSLLPPTLLDTAKVVFVARDPRDIAVSYFNFYKQLKNYGRYETLKQFWELFTEDLVVFSPIFPLLKEAWAQRDHPNMLFLFYEDIIKDMPGTVRRLAQYLGRPCSEEEVTRLSAHMHIDNMRNNPSVQPSIESSDTHVFVRQGKAGGWRDHFDEEMRLQSERWMQKHLAGTGLSFPGN